MWSLGAARCRFARYLKLSVNDQLCPVNDLIRQYPARRLSAAEPDLPDTVQGLGIRVAVHRTSAALSAKGEVDLGAEARFFPSDEALQCVRELMPDAKAELVYDANSA
jgi:DNA polymerase III subunit alpha